MDRNREGDATSQLHFVTQEARHRARMCRAPEPMPTSYKFGAAASALALVTADLCAGACLLCGDELECQRLAILREDGLAAPKQNRLDREEQLIDEVG